MFPVETYVQRRKGLREKLEINRGHNTSFE
jgi:hypothetical protein